MRVLILDSDKQNIEYLSGVIRDKYHDWNVSAYATAFALATAVYDEFKGDAELLMVHIEGDSSIELAKDVQEYFPHIRIIFYSGTTDWVEKIFKTVPTFFLRLPFQEEIVVRALERVRVGCEEDVGRTFVIQYRGRKQKIRFSSIQYIESSGRKMFFYTDDGSFETYMTVEDVLCRLPSQFMQCHRSYIINLNRIEKFCSDGVLLTNRAMVPISRSYQKKMKEMLE